MISSQDVTFSSRYLKTKKILEEAGAKTLLLLLSPPVADVNSVHGLVIAKPKWGGSSIASALAYRVQKYRVSKKLKQIGAHFVHALDYVALDVAAYSISSKTSKLFFDGCEIFSDTAYTSVAIKKYVCKIIKRCAPNVSGVLTPSSYLQTYYCENYPELPKSVIMSNAPLHRVISKYDGRLHKAAGLPALKKILLFHGGLSPKRGLRQLVSTAGELPQDYALVLMGWGVLQGKLQELAEGTNKTAGREIVKLLPPVPHDDLLDWVSGASFGIISYEPGLLNHNLCTPNKLYEYPAANVPVIGTDLQAIQEIISHHKIGTVLPFPLEGASLKSYLDGISKPDKDKLVDACRTFANDCSAASQMKGLIDLYSKTVSELPLLLNDQKNLQYDRDFMSAAKVTTIKTPTTLADENVAVDEGLETSNQVFQLGVDYQLGRGVAVDFEKAAQFYEKAADMDHAAGAYNLGVLYQAGLLGAGKLPKALNFYQRASELGHAGASEKQLEVLDVIDPELAGIKRVQALRQSPPTWWDRLIGRR